MIRLRPYQERGADQIRDAYRQGFRAPLYVAPTGSGKTVLFTYIAAGARARGNRVGILVHRQELVAQCSAALDAQGIAHGVIAPGFPPEPEPVQVCSVQTLVRRIASGRVAPFDLIVVDEAHHATAGSWGAVLEANRDARVLGVTATPQRLDGQGLGRRAGGVFDTLVEGPSIGELIADGYLSRPVVYAPASVLDLAGVTMRGGDYAKNEVEARVDKPTITGDAVDHYRRLCPGAPALAFCVSVAHARHVAAQFRAAGFRAACLDGKMDDRNRRQLIDALGSGGLDVLTSCEIVSEGTDIPVVVAAILLRPTASLGLYLQQVGRALRPVYAPGLPTDTAEQRLAAIAAGIKPRALILDHVGNCLTHGLPDERREWSLDGAPKESRGGTRDAPEVRIQRCPTCFAVHTPANTCPGCGHEYVVPLQAPKQVDGELQEITAEQAAALREQRRRMIARAQTLEDLREVARRLGYKPRWADYVWAGRRRKKAARGAMQ